MTAVQMKSWLFREQNTHQISSIKPYMSSAPNVQHDGVVEEANGSPDVEDEFVFHAVLTMISSNPGWSVC